MSRPLKFYLNNKEYTASQGETILDVALREGIEIPHLCKHPDLSVKANCRICLIEVVGQGIVTSCSTEVLAGMKIKTDTPKVKRARKINLELIFSEHIEKCDRCIYQDNCLILKYASQFGIKITRFIDRKKKYPIWQFSDSIQFDASKCIDCRNCVEVCRDFQACDFYQVSERGVETIVKPKGEAVCHSEGAKATEESRNLFASSHLREIPRGVYTEQSEWARNDNSVDLLKNDPDKFDCTYCGQCVVHCPVGAISGVPHWQKVEELLENRVDPVNPDKSGHGASKILIAQIAPAVRVSIGEEFGENYGKIMTGQLAASIKALGFDYAFDVNLGADFTTYEEAQELVHWLQSNKPRPMFTSCCPAWVKFVEFYYPEFISHLTTANSPHLCSGPVIKTYFANYLKRDPHDLVVISIMPCTAKKHEIDLVNHKIDLDWCIKRPGLNNICHSERAKATEESRNLFASSHSPASLKLQRGEREIPRQARNDILNNVKVPAVDYVLTTREYAYLLHRHKIDLPNLKPVELDQPLGIYSGAGAIYGVTGGVMESALRSADYFFRVLDEIGSLEAVLRGENYQLKNKRYSKVVQSRIEFKEVRGQQGIKFTQVKVGGKKLKVAVVNGLGNAKKILDNLKAKKVYYDYVEVMACPGGCIGGGGQPIPTNAAIRTKRAAALYEIDKNLPIRRAHENPALLEIYKNYFRGDKELIEKILHSGFKVREREGYRQINNQ